MSAKKGRRAKVLTVPPQESHKDLSSDPIEAPNLSSIDRDSFLDGLQQDYGNPLHSTAMEDDLNVPKQDARTKGRKAGKKEIPQKTAKTPKTAVKQRGAAVKRKEMERDEEEEEEEKKKRSRRSSGGMRSEGNQPMKKGKKRGSETGSETSSDTAPKKPAAARRRVLSSEEDEEDLDEDQSWKPSPKKATAAFSSGKRRKFSSERLKSRTSSSGDASAEPEKSSGGDQRMRRRGGGGETECEVVLDAFLEFCDQYREAVESKAVKEAVDSFSSNVREQLLEKISSAKELKALKRGNAKVGSSIRTKTQRLLDAKHELMRAERQTWLLHKEKAQLEVRLADLRRGRAFLQDVRELSARYLDYRRKHPKEEEMYGASSLPALLLETKYFQTAEHQQED